MKRIFPKHLDNIENFLAVASDIRYGIATKFCVFGFAKGNHVGLPLQIGISIAVRVKLILFYLFGQVLSAP